MRPQKKGNHFKAFTHHCNKSEKMRFLSSSSDRRKHRARLIYNLITLRTWRFTRTINALWTQNRNRNKYHPIYHFQLSYRPRHPFRRTPLLTPDKLNGLESALKNSRAEYCLYLYPNTPLLTYHFLFGIVIAASCAFTSLALSAIYIIFYFSVFHIINSIYILRTPVFERKIPQELPARLLPWLINSTPTIKLKSTDATNLTSSMTLTDKILSAWLNLNEDNKQTIPLTNHRPTIRRQKKYQKNKFSEEILLRAALADFFYKTENNTLSTLHFILFWCSPPIISGISLIAMLPTTLLLDTAPPNNLELKKLITPLLVWAPMTIWFTIDQYDHLRRITTHSPLKPDPIDFRDFPTPLGQLLEKGIRLDASLIKPKIAILFAIYYSGIFIFYLTILQLLDN